MISYAGKLNLSSLAESLLKNKEINKETLIHNKCRTELRNVSRKRLSTTEYVNFSNKSLSARSESKRFDFKTQCFYCEIPCVDFKHPHRNKFEEVRTKDTMVHKKTLAICKIKMTNKLNQLKEDY